MKKFLLLFMSVVTCLFSCFAFSACGCEHLQGTEKVIVEPTCINSGILEFTCSDCGKVMQKDISPLGHDFSIEISNTATCTRGGIAVYACSRCQKQENDTRESEALGHDFSGHFCTRCQELEEGFNYFEFNSSIFDVNNYYTHSLGTFVVCVGGNENSKDIKIDIYSVGKITGYIYWSVVIVNNTTKTSEAAVGGSCKIQYDTMESMSKEGVMKNAYNPLDEYYLRIKILKI